MGAGSSGKTRLAIQAATDLIDAFKDGVWWVELAGLSDGTLIPQAIAKALGVRESTNQPLQETLVNYLRGKQLLLVLDNCEHLVAACARTAEMLLQACPRLTILATSREPLGIGGERVWQVPTLSLPEPQQVIHLLMQSESVRLFVARAAAVRSDFKLTEQNALTVAHICRRLDGIPLAIELATARINALTVEQIAAHLNDRFELLTTGSRTAMPRHKTLRATIDWSYDLLSEAERVLFRRLSVFAGGWTLEAAETVCTDEGAGASLRLAPADVLNVLSHLADKSLVIVEQHGTQIRYRMLETIREFAREQMQASREVARMRQRHADYFLRLAQGVETKLLSAERMMWVEHLLVEIDNFRAALAWSEDTQHAEYGMRLSSALRWFWWTCGYVTEGRDWLQRALTLAGTHGEARIRAQTLFSLGLLAFHLGQYATSTATLLDSLALWKELGENQARHSRCNFSVGMRYFKASTMRRVNG